MEFAISLQAMLLRKHSKIEKYLKLISLYTLHHYTSPGLEKLFSILTASFSKISSNMWSMVSLQLKIMSWAMVDWALDTLIWEYLNSSIHLAPYLEEKFRRIYVGDAYKFYRQRYSVYWLTYWVRPGEFHWVVSSDKIILNNALDVEKGSSDIFSALKYFNSTTEYMMQLRTALGELRDDIE